jgi:hypothetical protein
MKLSIRALGTVFPLAVLSVYACTGEIAQTTPANDAGADVALDSSKPDTSTPDSSTDAATDAATEASTPDADAAPPFDVKSLTGLALWLDATQGVTGSSAVVAWADQSGNNNHAAMGSAQYQPALVASSIGGKPAIHFAGGTHLTVADSATLQWGTGDFYVAIVLKHSTASSTYGMVFSKQNPSVGPFIGPGIFANFALPSQGTGIGGQLDTLANHYVSTAASGLNDNVGRQFAFVRTGGVISVRLNGTPTTGASSAIDISAATFSLFIGANAVGTQALVGDIGEIIAVKGAIAAGDVTKVETYLKAKYSL